MKWMDLLLLRRFQPYPTKKIGESRIRMQCAKCPGKRHPVNRCRMVLHRAIQPAKSLVVIAQRDIDRRDLIGWKIIRLRSANQLIDNAAGVLLSAEARIENREPGGGLFSRLLNPLINLQ